MSEGALTHLSLLASNPIVKKTRSGNSLAFSLFQTLAQCYIVLAVIWLLSVCVRLCKQESGTHINHVLQQFCLFSPGVQCNSD